MKKGFTLIELLAVIVIVAIITLIATPIVSNIVNNSKVGALKSSAYGLLEASNLYYAQNGSKGVRFDINENVVSSNDTTKLLSYKGSIKRGTVIIDKKGNTTICITDGKNAAYKNYNDIDITTVTKETCNIPENRSVVYLESSGATRNEYTNQELTDELLNIKDEIASLKTQNETLVSIINENKNNISTVQSTLETTNTNLELVSTIANNAATKTELNSINELVSRDVVDPDTSSIVHIKNAWSSLATCTDKASSIVKEHGGLSWYIYGKHSNQYGWVLHMSYWFDRPIFCNIVQSKWSCHYLKG